MNQQQFLQNLDQKTAEFKAYANSTWLNDVSNTALRFINGNFRAQGWQGSSFQPWKQLQRPREGGSILRKTGHLASSFFATTAPGQVTIKTLVPYARAHNEGFQGTVAVEPFERKIKTVTGYKSVDVKGFNRNMNLPKRQFMPRDIYDSPILLHAIKRKTINGMKAIFNN